MNTHKQLRTPPSLERPAQPCSHSLLPKAIGFRVYNTASCGRLFDSRIMALTVGPRREDVCYNVGGTMLQWEKLMKKKPRGSCSLSHSGDQYSTPGKICKNTCMC